MLALVAPKHNSSAWVFSEWQSNEELHGIKSPPYVFLVGLLMSQWTIMGYEVRFFQCEHAVFRPIRLQGACPCVFSKAWFMYHPLHMRQWTITGCVCMGARATSSPGFVRMVMLHTLCSALCHATQ